MSLFLESERSFVEAMSKIISCNPFIPRRVELEREALGEDFQEIPRGYHLLHELHRGYPNIDVMCERGERIMTQARERLIEGVETDHHELVLYEDLILWKLYDASKLPFLDLITASTGKELRQAISRSWHPFRDGFHYYFDETERTFPSAHKADHIYACAFQVDRAYYYIHHYFAGTSKPLADLRAAVWESVFSSDLKRWARTLWSRMDENVTLIVGPSGTGKERVSKAVGLARHVPFDAKKEQFTLPLPLPFHAVNLAALAPTLIESELFGHVAGAFTDARERVGWLETCTRGNGTLFLDEIGELSPAIQVKLLRVIQEREFQRVGESELQGFEGKIIAATNRDLTEEVRAGRFREDLYFRLSPDVITTPSLQEQLRDAPEDLYDLIHFVAKHVTDEEEAESLSPEVHEWITTHLPDYGWPGNFRELEQCVRSVMLHRKYDPPRLYRESVDGDLSAAVGKGTLTLDELLRDYAGLVYEQQGSSYKKAAQVLDVDWRTVKAYVQS